MAKRTHIQEIVDFRGIDLRSSDMRRARGFLSEGTQNMIPSPQGGAMTRPGSKIIAKTYGSLGLAKFDGVNILGTRTTELVGFGADSAANSAKPYKLVRGSFTLTNSHASAAATVTHFYDEATSQFRFKIVRGGSTLIDQALGVGTEGSPYMLSSLETAVDALTSFSMSTPTNASTTPAAFMEILASETVAAASGTLTVYYWYWSAINAEGTPATDKSLVNYAYETGLDTFRNVSTVMLQNVLYISSGIKTAASVNGNSPSKSFFIMKYDGQTFARMGMNQIAGPTGATSNAAATYTDVRGTFARSNLISDNRTYRCQPVWVDKAGNTVEGNISYSSVTSSGADGIWSISLATSVAGSFGSLVGAHVNGTQTATTITVDSGHDMRVGDIAFFYDKAQGRCIQREVTAVASTSITVSTTPIDTDPGSPFYDTGATPQVYDNANITNNMRLRVWRTDEGGETLKLIAEVPYSYYSSSSGEFKYYDDGSVIGSGAEYIEPVYPRSRDSTPSIGAAGEASQACGRYLAAFNAQLIISGDDQRPNVVYFSDTDGPEYFPGTNEFEVDFPVTGIVQCGESLMVFTEDRTYLVSGDLGNFNFRVDEVAHDVGCLSHHSIQQLEEGVVVWLSKRGPYVAFGGRRIEPLGAMTYPDGSKVSRIESFFTQRYASTATQPVFKRALSAILPKDRLILFFVPFEDPTKPGYATSSSVLWVFDFGRGSWWKWTGWNSAGGMAVLDDVLYFAQRAHNGSAGTTFSNVTGRTWRQRVDLARTNSSDLGQYNFADHNAAISWALHSHWESLGEPGLFKRFLRCRAISQETRPQSSTAMTLTTYVDYDTSKTSFTDSFTWTTEKVLNIKVKSETCQAMKFAFSGASFYQRMILSGFELEAVASFRPEYKE